MDETEIIELQNWLLGKKIIGADYDQESQVMHLELDDNTYLIVSTQVFAKALKKNKG